MDVFGLEPIHATIVIAVVGVLLQVGLGYANSSNPIDGRNPVFTLLTKRNLRYSNILSCYLD